MSEREELAVAFGPLDARAAPGTDRIMLREHVVLAEVGAFHDERGHPQRLCFDVVVEVEGGSAADDVDRILSYDRLAEAIAAALAARRPDLLETLADGIAARILAFPQSRRVFLRIQKLDRGPGRLGVEISRSRGDLLPVGTALPVPVILSVPAVGEAERTDLARRLRSALPPGPAIVVATARGGVPPAGEAARHIALLALDQAAWALAGLSGLPVVTSRTEIDHARGLGGQVVWAPSRLALASPSAPEGADGAALARWLARDLGAAAPLHLPDPVPASPAAPPLPSPVAVPRPAICGLTLDRPRIMGILNLTPDSFSDGGDLPDVAAALAAARRMALHADILDIGGESTRPGAEEVPEAEEIRRTVPAIAAIRAAGITTPISIDTRKAAVAAAALDAGADMVNDISAMTWDSAMAGLVAERAVPVCLMHIKGTPRTMQDAPQYEDVVAEVHDWLAARVAAAGTAGIPRARILVDPGIGFGKTLQHNVTLLRGLARYHSLGCALMLGASRKRFIGTIGAAPQAKDRRGGSVAVALHGAQAGAHVLRVHDVEDTRQALLLWQALAGQEARDGAQALRD